MRSSRAQRNHVGLAIRAFLRLEIYWFNPGISWYDSKISIVREAVRSYLAAPWLSLPPTATNCVTSEPLTLDFLHRTAIFTRFWHTTDFVLMASN